MSACDVVICAHNEGPRIGAVLNAVTCSHSVARVIVVADACTDDTAWVAKQRGASTLAVDYHDKGSAMATGLGLVKSERVVFIDADLDGFEPYTSTNWSPPVPMMASSLTPDGLPALVGGLPSVSGERRLPTAVAHRAGIRSQAIQFYNAELAAKFGCPGPALSVIVESLVPSIDELVAKYSDDGLAYLEVDLIRGEDGEQGIQLWPRDDEPAHAVVFRMDGGRDLRGSLKKTLAEHLTSNWISLPESHREGP